ncbi:protein FAM118A-like isoform X4 [Ambystoma mexicanum]|uniref:protein FAM118A-like isoform X3 n=1 Tax=Ambystoma mexicanum TaxID=8296 RepID=UPI0037E7263F
MDIQNRDEQRVCPAECSPCGKRTPTPEREPLARCPPQPILSLPPQCGFTEPLTDCGSVLRSLTIKNPSDIVLVIGTGVSAAAAPTIDALFSWRCSLMSILDAAEELQVLHPTAIHDFRTKVRREQDLLVVAHELILEMSPRSGDLRPTFFRDCLLRIFDHLEQCITCPNVIETILSLIEKGAMVMTTNYDTFLESFGHHMGRPMESLDLQDMSKVLHWAKGHKRFGILHLHGKYAEPSGIAWDPTGFKELATNTEFKEALHTLYFKKSFVFIGCGETLRDHVFQSLFWHSTEKNRNLEHYMVVQKKDEDSFYKLQKDMLLLGIKVISFGENFTHFPQYLRSLSSLIAEERSIATFAGGNITGACRPECGKRRLPKCECDNQKKMKHSDEDMKRKSLKDTPKKSTAHDDGFCPTDVKRKTMRDTTKRVSQTDDDETGGECHL